MQIRAILAACLAAAVSVPGAIAAGTVQQNTAVIRFDASLAIIIGAIIIGIAMIISAAIGGS